jgi:hypothetical protein
MKDCTCTTLRTTIALLATGTGLAFASATYGAGETNLGPSKSRQQIITEQATKQTTPKRLSPMEIRKAMRPPMNEGGIAGGACPNPAHDCCTTGTAGCSDEVCCDLVCGLDPFCCNTSWDTLCVNQANSNCGTPPYCGAGGPCPNPDHDCCTTGTPGCSDEACCNIVCGADPFCCQTAWDTICVNEAVSMCGIVCGGGACPNPKHDCFTTGGPGCSDVDCCNTVCAADPFCCSTAWDGICVNEATTMCFAGDPPANDNCIDRIEVFDGSTAYTTLGATTDGPPHELCNDGFADPQVNQDVWFNYTATQTGTLQVDTCGSGYDTKLAVYDGCACPVSDFNLLGCQDDTSPCGLQSVVQVNVTAGNCYKIRVGGFGTAVGNGTLNLSYVVPCDTTCPPGAVLENEPCGTDTNGGCNSGAACSGASGNCCIPHGGLGCEDPVCQDAICAADPFCCETAWDGLCSGAACDNPACQCEPGGNLYTDIACGDTVCGNQWALGGTRDTDWYHFDQGGGPVTWTVLANAPTQAFILPGGCPPSIIATGSGACPDGIVVSTTLEEGTFTAFVSPLEFDGLPCGGLNNDYVASLTCVAPCPADINGDGVVDVNDLLIVINFWGNCPS